MNKLALKYFLVTSCLMVGLSIGGCSKKTELGSGPYFDAPQTAVQFYGKKPNPQDGRAGDKVTFEVVGLDKLKDFKFFINQIPAEVVAVTDSLATVVIPEGTSSGPASVLTVDGQYFYGPILKIDGRVSIDRTFKIGNGANGPIFTAYYNGAGNGMFLLGGAFSDFNNASASGPVNSIVKIAGDGTVQEYSAGKGAFGGTVSTILSLNSKYYIGGVLSGYGAHRVEGLTRLNDDCSIDTMVVDLVNPNGEKNPEADTARVPALNAYINGSVTRLFESKDQGIIAIGNFVNYYSYFYEGSQKDNYYVDQTEMYNFIRMDADGKLDSSYNFDEAIQKGRWKLNGGIADAIQLPDGKIIFVGSFTRFDGASAARIGALTDEGGLDPDFAANIGQGADGDIRKITFNKQTGKILVSGDFTQFDGHKANGIAMLNADGTYDDSFAFGALSGGRPSFAGQLNDGKIIVSGSFNKYNDIVRQGFMILNQDGTLAAGYNNTGSFAGEIYGMVEINPHSVVLYGYFTLFDNVKVGNIVKIAFD